MHRPELKSFIISFLQPQLLCQQFFHECIILNPGHQHIFSLLQLWSGGRGTGRAVLKMQSLHKKLPIWTLPTWSARESDLQVKSANSGSKVPKTTIYEIWLIEKMIIGSLKKETQKVTKIYSTTKLKISGWSSICGLRRSKGNWQLARGSVYTTWHGGCSTIFCRGICFALLLTHLLLNIGILAQSMQVSPKSYFSLLQWCQSKHKLCCRSAHRTWDNGEVMLDKH